MHVFIRKPDRTKLHRLIKKYQSIEVTQQNAGSTTSWSSEMFSVLPESNLVDGDLLQFRRTKLGAGESDYALAMAALSSGVCFDLSWVNCVKLRDFHENDSFCLLARALGLWTANFCRIVYISEDVDETEKTFAVGIGTLPRHAAIGEERLAINWNLETDDVDFLIGSYSKPGSFPARAFDGYLRRQQNKFAEDSAVRMKRALRSNGGARES